jgi:hypothetical protein
MADVADRVEEHFRLFNEAVRSQDWTAFLAGGGGTMRITWRDGAVAGLTVTFDALWCLPRARDHRENRHDVA